MEEMKTTNTKSLVSLILGIFSLIIPFIGLILSIAGIIYYRLGIKEIEQTNQGGRGLAIGGLVCSIIGIVFQVLIIIGIFAFFSLITEM